MKQVEDAKKTRIDEKAAWELLRSARVVSVAKGKKIQNFTSVPDEKEAILKQAMGPSGNLRAPTWQAGDRFVIGFNADLYEDWLK